MFLGAIPRQLCEQLVRVLPFAEWQDVFVCCSGSFRVDQAIHKAAPEARVHGNDVSLYSTVIGRLATKEPFALTFADRLAFVEDVFQARGGGSFQARCAAVLLAHEMSRYARKNAYAEKHFAYEEGMNILQYHSKVRPETPQQMYDDWFRKVTTAAQPQKGRRRGNRNP